MVILYVPPEKKVTLGITIPDNLLIDCTVMVHKVQEEVTGRPPDYANRPFFYWEYLSEDEVPEGAVERVVRVLDELGDMPIEDW